MTKKSYLTPTEVAQLLMVSPVTVRQWAQKGMLPALNTPGGHRRFLTREVERFARTQGLTLQTLDHDGTLRILLVGRDKTYARYLLKLLTGQQSKVSVETAYDGFEAGAKIQTFKPHLIILDFLMQGIDGYLVCKQIKTNPMTKSMRVIAISNAVTPEAKKRIIRSGAEECLVKPIKGDTLLALIGIEKNQTILSKRRAAIPA